MKISDEEEEMIRKRRLLHDDPELAEKLHICGNPMSAEQEVAYRAALERWIVGKQNDPNYNGGFPLPEFLKKATK